MAARTWTRREIIFVAVGVVVALLIPSIPMARGLARDYRENRSELSSAQTRLRDAAQLRQIIEQERAARELMAERMGRDEQFSLYDAMQTALTRAGMGNRMRLEKRGAASQYVEVVNVSLQGIGLQELTDFLHSAYAGSRPVALQQLDYLRPARNGQGLDCSMTLMSPRL